MLLPSSFLGRFRNLQGKSIAIDTWSFMAKFTCGPCDSKSMIEAHLFTIFSYISIYNIKQMFFLLVNSHSIYFVLYFLKCHLHYKLLVWLHDYLYLPVPSKFIMVATKRGTYQPRQLKDQFGSKVSSCASIARTNSCGVWIRGPS